jgi:hypothetical protein
MAHAFLLHILRGFISITLLLRSYSVSTASTPCPQSYCIYLPVTSIPATVSINEIRYGSGGKYTRELMGDVINNSNFLVYNVVVQATFNTDSGLQTNSLMTFLSATLPGQYNGFTFESPSRNAFISATVLSWSITPTVSYSNLTVVASHAYTVPLDDPTGERDFYAVVTGTLRNDTSKTLKDMQIYVWNVAKTVSNRQTILPVAPGATVTFSAALGAEVLPTDTIRIVAQGVVSP